MSIGPTISYGNFLGATSGTSGAGGLVPAPAAGDEGKALLGDGTWTTLASALPSQTSNSGKLLTTNGTTASWTTTPVATSLTAPASTDLTLTAGSGNQGIVVAGTGSGATATATNTGGLRSANFGLSTVSGGASYFGGEITASSGGYFGAGNNPSSLATPYVHSYVSGTSPISQLIRSASSANKKTFEMGSYADGVTTFRFVNDAYNATANVMTMTGDGASSTSGVVNIPGTTSASTSTTGALTVGNGTAATNVAIGGGNVWAGGTITGGTDTTATNATYDNRILDSTGNYHARRWFSSNGIKWIEKVAANVDGNRYSLGKATGLTTLTEYFGINNTSGDVAITSTSPSTSSTTGALQVAGGIYAGAASVFAGTVTVSSSAGINSAGNLTLSTATDSRINWTAGQTAWLNYNVAADRWTFRHTSTGVTSLTLTEAATTVGNALVTSSTTLSGAGAIPITTSLVKFTSTGAAQALTLANGVDGQRLTIVHDVDGGSGVLTPTTKTGFSTITFTNAGDTVDLVYVTTRGWMVTGSYLAIIAP